MKIRQMLFFILGSLLNRKMVNLFTFLKPFRRWVGVTFIPSECLVDGKKMFLHRQGHSFELTLKGVYEQAETELVKKLNLTGTISIDIGACIGYYSLLLSERVGTTGKVISFEPEKKNFVLLGKNIAANNLINVSAYNLAVGDYNGFTFLKESESPGQHLVFKKTPPDEKMISIKMVSLDDFLVQENLDYSKISFVKIDVEGCELEVLRGMTRTIAASKKLIIQFELAPQHLREHGYEMTELVDFIKNNKLRLNCWSNREKKWKNLSDIDWLKLPKVINDFERGIRYSRNLICFKSI